MPDKDESIRRCVIRIAMNPSEDEPVTPRTAAWLVLLGTLVSCQQSTLVGGPFASSDGGGQQPSASGGTFGAGGAPGTGGTQTGLGAAGGSGTAGATPDAGGGATGQGGAGGVPGTGGTQTGPGGAGGSGTAGATPDAGGGATGQGGAGGAVSDLRSGPFKILVLSTTLEFHHDSIPAGLQMLTDLGMTSDAALVKIGAPAGSQWTVDSAGSDPTKAGYFSEFTTVNLKNYEMVYSDNPTGAVFTLAPNSASAKAAFQNFMMTGGAWAGQHSATDFENMSTFTWFQDQVNGGWFVIHDSDGTPGTIAWEPSAATHPILRGIPTPWSSITDEWYVMNRDIAALPGFQVLGQVTVPTSSLNKNPRPAVWIHELPGGGRSFYTIRGHNIQVYAEPAFRQLMLQGILWAVHRLK
jgi:type 1 glutamine amidotransferase